MPTHINTGNYLVGLVIGYFYYHYKQSKNEHQKSPLLHFLWNCSWFLTFVLCLVGLYFYENDIELGVLSSLLGAFFKHFYGAILGVLIVGIFLRYGFIVPNVFNYGMYRILARLSFSVYMVHISIGWDSIKLNFIKVRILFKFHFLLQRSIFIMKNKFAIEINNSMLIAFTGTIYMMRWGKDFRLEKVPTQYFLLSSLFL
jgi:hypothetical protein